MKGFHNHIPTVQQALLEFLRHQKDRPRRRSDPTRPPTGSTHAPTKHHSRLKPDIVVVGFVTMVKLNDGKTNSSPSSTKQKKDGQVWITSFRGKLCDRSSRGHGSAVSPFSVHWGKVRGAPRGACLPFQQRADQSSSSPTNDNSNKQDEASVATEASVEDENTVQDMQCGVNGDDQ